MSYVTDEDRDLGSHVHSTVSGEYECEQRTHRTAQTAEIIQINPSHAE